MEDMMGTGRWTHPSDPLQVYLCPPQLLPFVMLVTVSLRHPTKVSRVLKDARDQRASTNLCIWYLHEKQRTAVLNSNAPADDKYCHTLSIFWTGQRLTLFKSVCLLAGKMDRSYFQCNMLSQYYQWLAKSLPMYILQGWHQYLPTPVHIELSPLSLTANLLNSLSNCIQRMEHPYQRL